MLIPGHLASAVVATLVVSTRDRGRAPWRAALLPAALGGLTPDLIDKTRMALGGSVYGRTVGHSLLFLGVMWAAWLVVRGVRPGLGRLWGFWALGVASHLVADLADDALRGWMGGGMVASSWFAWPWATPYTSAVYAQGRHWTAWNWPITPLEAAVVAGAAAWLVLSLRRPAQAAP